MNKEERNVSRRHGELLESCRAGLLLLASTPILRAVELVHELWVTRPEGPFRGWYDQYVGAIASVAANLAEGIGKGTRTERLRFVAMARGSAYEAVLWAVMGDAGRLSRVEALAALLDEHIVGELEQSEMRPAEPCEPEDTETTVTGG